MAYQDEKGEAHQLTLRQRDLYGLLKVGDTVELRYLAETPEEVVGPACNRDVMFTYFVPRLILVSLTSIVLSILIGFVARR